MTYKEKNPRILIVTPEVTYLPHRMGGLADSVTAKAGGLADVSAALISSLFDQGADVHVALPNYRSIFNGGPDSTTVFAKQRQIIRSKMPDERIHLAEDRAFFYVNNVYSNYSWENAKIAIAFQREVINNIVPHVQPDLIHCNDWMTGIIPGMARQLGIPCLFTIHNIFSIKCLLADIEDRGIDAASFWYHLYYEQQPSWYEDTREANPVDFLTSGVFAAHYVNTVSPTFLLEMVDGRHPFVEYFLKRELTGKCVAGCATGILNAPEPSFNPATDDALTRKFTSKNHVSGKKENKKSLQRQVGLIQDSDAPLFFWPSRLDTIQKGCQLLAEILYNTISLYWENNLQIIFVAEGEFHNYFYEIISKFNLSQRVALCGFDEKLARKAYAASDFILMPSAFEPCGLPQMISQIYGSLPVAHDTGGIHDTVQHLDIDKDTGNGFLFKTFDSNGLAWAISKAMEFFRLPKKIKNHQVKRIMEQSVEKFNHSVTAASYIKLYEKMIRRPFIVN